MHLFSHLAAFAAGLCGAMGFGSGTVLLLFLTAVLALDQQTAQGINLLFFLPCGLAAFCCHAARRALPLRRVPSLVLFSLPGAVLGYFLLGALPVALLRRLFGAFLVVLAFNTFFSLKSQKKKQPTSK